MGLDGVRLEGAGTEDKERSNKKTAEKKVSHFKSASIWFECVGVQYTCKKSVCTRACHNDYNISRYLFYCLINYIFFPTKVHPIKTWEPLEVEVTFKMAMMNEVIYECKKRL